MWEMWLHYNYQTKHAAVKEITLIGLKPSQRFVPTLTRVVVVSLSGSGLTDSQEIQWQTDSVLVTMNGLNSCHQPIVRFNQHIRHF